MSTVGAMGNCVCRGAPIEGVSDVVFEDHGTGSDFCGKVTTPTTAVVTKLCQNNNTAPRVSNAVHEGLPGQGPENVLLQDNMDQQQEVALLSFSSSLLPLFAGGAPQGCALITYRACSYSASADDEHMSKGSCKDATDTLEGAQQW
jgi:hypothetical protein